MNSDRNPRQSAYAGSVADWRSFLSCWYREHVQGVGSRRTTTVIKRDVAIERPAISDDAILEEVRKQEQRLGFALPRSYVDFVVAYYPTSAVLQDVDLLRISSIDRVGVVFPGWGKDLMAYNPNPGDKEYFTYGVEQVDTTRARYLKTAIVVGMHDMDSPFLLMLHPEVLTADGEMEAEAFFQAGSVRTPSFAEMMRQLYLSHVRPPSGSPAISQEMLRGTCADLLPMKGVWWK